MSKTSLCLLILSLVFSNCNQKLSNTNKWELIWNDEFENNGLPDTSKWNYETGGSGWGNHELQFYTNNRTKNARVENGMLIIEAVKEDTADMHYTSSRLVTKGKASWQYGKIEIKAKLPNGRGTWPAIWMLADKEPLNWPDDGEIDIMEHVGFNQGVIHASVHCKKYYHVIGTQKTATIKLPDCSENFHVYAMEWNNDSVKVSVDENIYFRFGNERSGYDGWPFDNKMFLLLNIAVGGDWGGKEGVDSTIFPKQMIIDYVRVYKQK